MADVRLTATNPEDSSVVPVACDASGRLLLEERGEGPEGPQGPPGPPGQDGQDGKDGDPFSGNFADDVTFGGDATVAGLLRADTRTTGNGTAIYAQNTSVSSDDAPVRILNGSNAGGVGNGFLITGRGTSNEEVFYVTNDGSAQFDGDVQAGGNAQQGRYSGVVLRQLGVVQVAREAGEGIFTGFQTSDNNLTSNATSTIYSDGSITLAGGKAGFTKEGYLWCTTRRGDTVILDVTSNGLASWVEYVPTSRIDELRDKLDANRPDTGEMPADTP